MIIKKILGWSIISIFGIIPVIFLLLLIIIDQPITAIVLGILLIIAILITIGIMLIEGEL